MTYRGHVKNGVVVLDDKPALAEGTAVVVSLAPANGSEPDRGTPQAVRAFLQSDAGWHEAYPGEMDRIFEDLQATKRAEVEAQTKAEREGGGDATSL